ncbi:DUF1330 domain-containing protein [Mesorhizobium sp. M0621]|uniref:DUF1330 domain-containing protein n=1 Tax=Mesorhizobium sp. M0621 TaxID=2956974 RepID=UPI0033350591
MAAYLIADVDIKDAAEFEEYRRDVPATEARYGGRYLGRSGATKVLEGDWEPHRLVIIEFPDMASLMGWYNSPEYARLIEIRKRCASTRIIALEGSQPMHDDVVISPSPSSDRSRSSLVLTWRDCCFLGTARK